MARLPFLVVHGAAVWVALVVAVAAGAAWRRRRLGGWHAGVAAGVAGALAIAALWAAGALVMSLAQITHRTLGGHGFDGPRVAYELGEIDPLALASALPGHRDRALDELTGRFEAYYVRDAASLAGWQRVARIRGGCAGELAMLRDQERIAELARLAPDCDDNGEVTQALLLLGDYAGAARRTERTASPEIDALIGARAWAAVARSVAALRAQLARGENHSLYTALHPDVFTQIGPRLTCGELYFRIRAGEPDAADKLHAAVAGDPICRVIDALTQPLDRQGEALREAYQVAPDAFARRTIEPLAWAAGAPLIEHAHHYDNSLDPGRLLQLDPLNDELRPALLAPFAAAVRHDPEGSRAAALTRLWLAQYAVLRGDLRAATAAATAVGLAGSPDQPDDLAQDAQSFAVALALRAGAALPDGLRPHAYLSPLVVDPVEIALGHTASLTADLPVPSIDCTPGDPAELQIIALTSAIAGDAALLSELFDRCGVSAGLGSRNLFGLWPRIRTGRDRLRAQLAVALPDISARRDPFDVLRRALLRRDLARLTGDTAGATAWQALIDRHLTVLADRDVAVALLLWHLL